MKATENKQTQHGAAHNHTAPAGTRVKDPVCGMMVDPARAAGQHSHKGTTYHFCNPKCLDRFQADPE